MDLEKKYRLAYESLGRTVGRCLEQHIYTALGFTSNLDCLCDIRAEEFNRLLDCYLPGENLEEMQAVEKISSMEELLRTMVFYCLRGIGGEVDVENTELLEKNFPFTHGMGGTAMQAALALSEIGCPAVVHLTDDSKEVRALLNTPYVYGVSTDKILAHMDSIEQLHEQEPHYIVQFQKGEMIRLGGRSVRIPCSNRLILTKITVNARIPLFEPYFTWVESHAGQVASTVFSSFNAVTDEEVLKERLAFLERHARAYRSNHPEGIVLFEDAHFHNREIRRLCQQMLYPCVDIVSLNEEELRYSLTGMHSFRADTDDIISCVQGAEFLRRRLGIRKGVVVHTKDYTMYVGEALKADIEKGLMYGNLLATAKAKNGWYGNLEQVKEVLGYQMSEKGMEYYRTLQESDYAKNAIFVPTKYIDKPKYTIGLGDSFVGGLQICFMETLTKSSDCTKITCESYK